MSQQEWEVDVARELFWRSVDDYRAAAYRWRALMEFIDGRGDYSLAMFESELDDLAGELFERCRPVIGPTALDKWDACRRVCLQGQEAFDTVMASPETLVRHVDVKAMDAFEESRESYWQGQ